MTFKIQAHRVKQKNCRIHKAVKVIITYGYGESDFENPGSESALTSVLGTEFISGIAFLSVSTFESPPTAFCTLSVVAGSGIESTAAGRALLITGDGRRAFPIC